MRSLLFLIFLSFTFSCTTNQTLVQNNDPCLTDCDIAGDEKKNTDMIHDQMEDEEMMDKLLSDTTLCVFPLRIGIVERDVDNPNVSESSIQSTIEILNTAFAPADLQFYIAQIDYIQSPLTISLLQKDFYDPYNAFSAQHDLQDTISVYFFDYDTNLCDERDGVLSCGRTGGFSYILSNVTNNIVISKFDIGDHKIIAHEFGHFFGLYHTFEEHQFGKETISRAGCSETGDRICDTPADPGTLYEVYVNYSKCEMIGNFNAASKAFYKPLINNYMSYYKPCYLEEYTFTPMQLDAMKVASRSVLRDRFRAKR